MKRILRNPRYRIATVGVLALIAYLGLVALVLGYYQTRQDQGSTIHETPETGDLLDTSDEAYRIGLADLVEKHSGADWTQTQKDLWNSEAGLLRAGTHSDFADKLVEAFSEGSGSSFAEALRARQVQP